MIYGVNSCLDLGVLQSNSFSYDDHIPATVLLVMYSVGIIMKKSFQDIRTRVSTQNVQITR